MNTTDTPFAAWEADNRPTLAREYRGYLRDVIDDDGFDPAFSGMEDYDTWAREEYDRAMEEGRD